MTHKIDYGYSYLDSALMADGVRIVLDTNVLLSGLLFPGSIPARALERAQAQIVLASEATIEELARTISRPRFDRYLDAKIRRQLVESYRHACFLVEITQPVRACRDPRDDLFLEVALHGQANMIVSGDEDLLSLHPFHGISILNPAAFPLEQASK
jgi:putative PIN family toxin of toxin-antitoxin system